MLQVISDEVHSFAEVVNADMACDPYNAALAGSTLLQVTKAVGSLAPSESTLMPFIVPVKTAWLAESDIVVCACGRGLEPAGCSTGGMVQRSLAHAPARGG